MRRPCDRPARIRRVDAHGRLLPAAQRQGRADLDRQEHQEHDDLGRGAEPEENRHQAGAERGETDPEQDHGWNDDLGHPQHEIDEDPDQPAVPGLA